MRSTNSIFLVCVTVRHLSRGAVQHRAAWGRSQQSSHAYISQKAEEGRWRKDGPCLRSLRLHPQGLHQGPPPYQRYLGHCPLPPSCISSVQINFFIQKQNKLGSYIFEAVGQDCCDYVFFLIWLISVQYKIVHAPDPPCMFGLLLLSLCLCFSLPLFLHLFFCVHVFTSCSWFLFIGTSHRLRQHTDTCLLCPPLNSKGLSFSVSVILFTFVLFSPLVSATIFPDVFSILRFYLSLL